jgi:outer membrane receptor protein involved in Fe transport
VQLKNPSVASSSHKHSVENIFAVQEPAALIDSSPDDVSRNIHSSVSSKLDYVEVNSSGTPSYKVIVEEVQQSVSNYSQRQVSSEEPVVQKPEPASTHKDCIVGVVKKDSPNFDQIG